MQISTFQSLSPSMLEMLSETATITEYPRNTTLYQQQESLTGLYVVVSGYVKLYRQSRDRVQILAILRDEDFLGTECLSSDTLSSSSATTMTSSTLIHIPSQAMYKLLEANPQFRLMVLHKVTDRLRQFAQLVHNLAFRDVTARLAMLLVTRAETDGIMTVDGIRILRLMTQSEIATMIGTGREVVQRTFKKFHREGLIQVSRKEILILDIDNLRIMAEEENR
jgi:CRP/FNR family transcriptional regulator, cyclic AMP receptor protein